MIAFLDPRASRCGAGGRGPCPRCGSTCCVCSSEEVVSLTDPALLRAGGPSAAGPLHGRVVGASEAGGGGTFLILLHFRMDSSHGTELIL